VRVVQVADLARAVPWQGKVQPMPETRSLGEAVRAQTSIDFFRFVHFHYNYPEGS
jgi:hypothetical protein